MNKTRLYRLKILGLLPDMCVYVVHSLLDCCNFLCFFIGNFALEFLFKSHDQLDSVKRICAETNCSTTIFLTRSSILLILEITSGNVEPQF